MALFNVCLSDMHKTGVIKFGYADNWAIPCQSHCFKIIESRLAHLQTQNYKHCFHLDNHHAVQIRRI